MKRPRWSDLGIVFPHPVITINAVWIEGVRHRLADDGDTLLPDPETQEEQAALLALLDLPGALDGAD